MKRPYQITGALLLLFSISVGKEAQELKFYTTLGPGPGFFPFWLSVIMGVLSLVMLFQSTFQEPEPMPDDFFASRVGYVRALCVCIAMIAVVFLLEKIGFRYSMAAFFLFLLYTLGRPHWADSLLVVIVGSLGTFKLFDGVLKVPLPQAEWDGPATAIWGFLEGPVGIALFLAYVIYRAKLLRLVMRATTAKSEG